MYLVTEVETGEIADDVGDVDDGAVVLEVYLVGGEVFEVAYGVYYEVGESDGEKPYHGEDGELEGGREEVEVGEEEEYAEPE